MPAVSVVTATYNRVDRLRRLLTALDGQSVRDLEVIVVDDRSTDGTWAMLQEAEGRYPWLRVVRMTKNGGPARARNVGWRTASSPVIAFTDDDCVPDSVWADRLLEELQDPDVDIVQGATSPDPARWHPRGPFDHSILVDHQSPMFETCNLGIRRDLLERLSGFDESFPFAYGEDCDLGWRGLELGAVVRYAPKAQVTHDVISRSFREQLRGERRRIALVTVVRRHPGLRQHLFAKVFYDQTHARLVAAVLAAGLLAGKPTSVPRWVVAGGTTAYYARLRFLWSITRGPRSKWPGWMIQLFLLDVTDVTRLMKQSVHEKTLVL